MQAVKRGIRGNVEVRIYLDAEQLMADPRYLVTREKNGLLAHYFSGFYVSSGGTRQFFSIDSTNGGVPSIFDPFIKKFSIQEYLDKDTIRVGRYFGKQFGPVTAEVEGFSNSSYKVTIQGDDLGNLLKLFDAIQDPNQKWQEVGLADAEESYEAIEKAQRQVQAKKEAGYWKRLWLAILGR